MLRYSPKTSWNCVLQGKIRLIHRLPKTATPNHYVVYHNNRPLDNIYAASESRTSTDGW